MRSWLERKIRNNARNRRLTYVGIYAYDFAYGIFYRCPFWLARETKVAKNGARYSAWQFSCGGYWYAYDPDKGIYREVGKSNV